MKKTTITNLVAVAVLASATSAQAALTITFDKIAETFSITGSGSGNPGGSGSFPGSGFFSFERTDLATTVPLTSVDYDDDAVYTTSASIPGHTGGNGWDVQLLVFTPGAFGTRMALGLALSDQTPTTISGTGVPRSYASLSTEAKSYIEGLDGSTLTANTSTYGGSWSGGPVNISVVPEPGTFVLAALGLAGLALRRRRC